MTFISFPNKHFEIFEMSFCLLEMQYIVGLLQYTGQIEEQTVKIEQIEQTAK